MEFGKVPDTTLNKIDFTLPPDPAFNKKILNGKPVKSPKMFIGCDKWGRKEWVGSIYPSKTIEKDFLNNYVNHFNCIELNATHYKVYQEEDISKWAQKAGNKDFRFCPKMYKGITHFGSLKGKELITKEFIKEVVAFKKHLGPIFIQLSESFAPKRKQELFTYLESLPTDLQFFLELRHPEWFSDNEIIDELINKLASLKIGMLITDTAGRRDCVHMTLTVPKAFIRFAVYDHPSDLVRMDLWISRIKEWLNSGLEELYLFVHMFEPAKTPFFAAEFIDRLNKECDLNIAKPLFIKKDKQLFEE